MTIFKDRLASSIRIKRRFSPSRERIRESRNRVIAIVMLLLLVVVTTLVFKWLET